MKRRRLYTFVLKVLAVLFCCLFVWIFISTRTLFMKLCGDNVSLDIDSISIDTYSNIHINNIRDKEFIDTISEYLQDASFAGYIYGETIRTQGDKICCRLVIAFNGGNSYEVFLSSDIDDLCHIKPLKGLFSNRIHIKIQKCEKLYNYIWSYIESATP